MSFRGQEVRVVPDVPSAFASLTAETPPGTFAVSGGGTARRCYEALRVTGGINWQQIDVFLGDERWVPVDHEDSNEGMTRRVLLEHVPVRSIHSVREAGPTIAEAADSYDELVRRTGTIDVIHLGLGPDGHTASLFPGSPALGERDRLVVATGDDEHPHPRVTFTLPAIERGAIVVVTVEGAEKREAFARVARGEDVPAARIRARRVVWLVSPDVLGA